MRSLTGARRRLVAAIDGLRGRPTRVWEELSLAPPPRGPVPALPTSSEPRVSVLVPVYGQLRVTLDCLESLAALRTAVPFEVLVLDDATPHEDMSPLAAVQGIRYLRAGENRGFLRNMNWGAAQARGEILLLLNNDTLVDPGFLDPLVEVLDRRPDVGVVGSMLLYPNGVVQEAGGIIWNDASGWNYGRHEPSTDGRVRWTREVDYCSGASLAVRRSVWDALGGFDEQFAPAYYEDTDLCFGARALGHSVVYEPRSRVVHLEGVSHGTDEAVGVKRYQVENRAKFAAKWAEALTLQERPHTDRLLLARDRRRGCRVVVADHRMPTPDRDSGSLRMSLLVESLAALGAAVHFYPVAGEEEGPLADRWRAMGIEVLPGDSSLLDIVRQLADDLDAVVLSRPHVAATYLLGVRELAPNASIVYDMVDAHGIRKALEADLLDDDVLRRTARQVHRFECAICEAADLVLAVSDDERRTFEAQVADGARFMVMPNIHPTVDAGPGPEGRSGVLFVGSYQHPPNVDAAKWFVSDILPLLPEGTEATLAGADPGDDVTALASDVVHVPGWVADLGPLYDLHRVAVAPLRYGAGVKGKVGDALSRGVPLVTTSFGAEGLGLVDGVHCLVADDAAGFAACVRRLLDDDDLCRRLAADGRAHILREFGTDAALARADQLLRSVRR